MNVRFPFPALWLGLLLLGASCTSGKPTAPAPQTADTALPPAHIALVDIASGETVLAAHEGDAVPPASTIKVVTALSALDALPPGRRYTTRVCEAEPGVLLLEGGGAPYLPMRDMKRLALLMPDIDADRFVVSSGDFPVTERIAPGQPVDAAYNPVIAGLLPAEGAYRQVWNTGADARLEAASIPDLPAANVEERADKSAPHGLKVRGWRSVANPIRYAGEILRRFAGERGIALPEPEVEDRHACAKVLASVESETVAALVHRMLEASSNPMAEILGIHAAIERSDEAPPQSIAEAAEATDRWLKARFPAVDWTGFALPNHSGLSIDARVTARQMAEVLAAAYRSSEFRTLPALLSPAGWDGGLADRLAWPDSALRIWGKTGTIHYAIGVVGYIFSDTAPPRAFAVYIHDPGLRAAYNPVMGDPPDAVEHAADAWDRRARARIDEILTAILTHNPTAE